MGSFKTLDDMDVAGKRVMVRVDINVPVENGKVTDMTRVERILPTLKELIDKKAKVILLAHYGRPKGKIDSSMSLAFLAPVLSKVLGQEVAFSTDCTGVMADTAVAALAEGDVLLMENTRFHEGEEANDAEFASALAANGDIFVNDAFSAAHRAHASTVGIAEILPACAGRTMQAELDALEKGLLTPEKPLVAVVGGAKVSSKLDLLLNLVKKVDALIIGGGMANTFLAAKGVDVGKSLCEHDLAATAKQIMIEAANANCAIVLPVDGLAAKEFAANAPHRVVSNDDIAADEMVLDVGPKSIEQANAWVAKAKTLVWNGPFGAFEITPFDTATVSVAQFAAQRTESGELISVAGGGDTVAALNHAGAGDKFTYVSTAGGAFLEWLEGKTLPGVAVLG